VTERALAPGGGPCPCGAFAEGAICTPLEDEAFGAEPVCVLAEGAGTTGALVEVVPGCCAPATRDGANKQNRSNVARVN
jgi:hypothetical protein